MCSGGGQISWGNLQLNERGEAKGGYVKRLLGFSLFSCENDAVSVPLLRLNNLGHFIVVPKKIHYRAFSYGETFLYWKDPGENGLLLVIFSLIRCRDPVEQT